LKNAVAGEGMQGRCHLTTPHKLQGRGTLGKALPAAGR
jgi:hypothetical protein